MPRRAVQALLGAGGAAALLFITWFAAFHIGVFERADQQILSGFVDLGSPRVRTVALDIARLCDPKPYVYLAAIPVLIALLRRRPRVAALLGAAMLGANVTTQLLKPLLAHPRVATLFGGVPPVAAASWPSGHATAAMSLALCSVIAVPSRLRPYVAALGAAFAVAVSFSFLTLEWHYPSDVFGGFLIAAGWTLLACSAALASDPRQPRRAAGDLPARTLTTREALGPPALAVLGALGLVGLVALARPHEVEQYASAHSAFVVGAAAIAALGLMLATGVMLALRRER
jgi:membrane-associated phospholipid phosphatase